MDCRIDESCNFFKTLGFRIHDVINTNEHTVISAIKDAFEGESIFIFININLQLKLMY